MGELTTAGPLLRVDFAAGEQAASESAWCDLPMGVRIKLRTLTGLVAASIEAQIARELYAFHQGADVLERFGFSAEDAGLLADETIALGFAGILHAVIRGVNLIEDWNLADPEGEPLEVTPQSVRALFHVGPVPGSGPVVMAAFARLVDTPAYALAREKKGSASSPNGGTAEGASTAPAAASTATPAPTGDAATATSAPKSSRRRTPPRASLP